MAFVSSGAIGVHAFAGERLPVCSSSSSRTQRSAELQMVNLPKMPSLPNPFKKKGTATAVPAKTKAVSMPKKAPTPPPAPKVRAAGGAAPISSKPRAQRPRFEKPKLKAPEMYTPENRSYTFQRNTRMQGTTQFDRRFGVDGLHKLNNDRVNDIGTFRNMDEYTDELVWTNNDESRAVTVKAVYKQVFGNAYLFESDLAALKGPESAFVKHGDVKEFVRALGCSSVYKSKFFDKMTTMRFVELNFKHFLGRAPRSQAEWSTHIQLVNNKGIVAEINSYLDSPEFDSLFGTTRVPAINFKGGHETDMEMNRLAILNGTPSDADVTRKKARFPAFVGTTGVDAFSVEIGLPPAWRGENRARAAAGLSFKVPGMRDNSELIVRDELAWKMKMGKWATFYYKDSLPYQQIIKPNLVNSDEEKKMANAILKYGSLMAKSYV